MLISEFVFRGVFCELGREFVLILILRKREMLWCILGCSVFMRCHCAWHRLLEGEGEHASHVVRFLRAQRRRVVVTLRSSECAEAAQLERWQSRMNGQLMRGSRREVGRWCIHVANVVDRTSLKV